MDAVEGEAVNPGVGIDADRRQAKPINAARNISAGLRHHAAEAGDGKHHQREIFRRAERQRPLGEAPARTE